MLYKVALCEIAPLHQSSDGSNLIKTASGNISVTPGSEQAKIIEAEIKKHPTALFFRAKAIKADEMNSNGDYFTSDELIRAHKTFEGVPFFTNHDNQNVENARGKIVFAEWIPQEKSIYVIAFIDREAFPDICRSIEEDYITGVSMGSINGEAMIVMEDLSLKPIENIVSGEKVISPFGNICEVLDTHCDVIDAPMYKFVLRSYHKGPLFSPDHPILTIKGEEIRAQKEISIKRAIQNKNLRQSGKTDIFVGQDGWRDHQFKTEFIEAQDIDIDDFILVPSKYKLLDKENDEDDLDLYYLAGAYLGDGYVLTPKSANANSTLNFYIGLHEEKSLGEKIIGILSKKTDKKIGIQKFESKGGMKIGVSDSNLADFMVGNFKKLAHHKRVCKREFTKAQISSLVSGYIDTDGCIVKTYTKKKDGNIRGNGIRGVQISSCNEQLLEDIQSLLILLDISTYIKCSFREANENSVVNVPTIEYTLFIPYGHLTKIRDSLKINATEGILEPQIKAGKTFIVEYNGNKYMACPVKDIEIVDFQKPTYDLTVEEDESYIANGLAIHNCAVEYSVCSICGNRAERTEDYCAHIRNRKGRKFSGKSKDVKTGEVKEFRDADVYEYNYGIKFIELSAVVDPACPSCRIQGLIPNDDYLKRVANLQNELYMIKTSAMHKKAGQEEIQQLNQCLQTLEQLAVKLIQNRQQIEVEFASDLVSILSELQEFTDELIGAGYANVQQQGIPGVAEQPPQAPVGGGAPGAIPVVEETPLPEPAGNVAGSPNKPLVQTPQLPITAPAKPMAMNTLKLQKVASLIDSLNEKLGDDDMPKRRTKSERIEQIKHATEVLSNSWQEKQDFFEYITKVPSLQNNDNKLSVKKSDDTFIIVAENKDNVNMRPVSQVWTYEDLNDVERRLITENPHEAALYFLDTFSKNISQQKEGVNVMTDNKRSAGANSVNKAPDVVQEAQLENTQGLYHGRTGEDKHSITQKQLEDSRKGEKDVITEAQLDEAIKLHPRENSDVDAVQEAQLRDDKSGASPRKSEDVNEITQAQLGANRTGTDPDVITEKQLDSVAAPWERAASRDASLFKSAGEHMQSVINVIADTVISTGCTPDEAVAVAGSMVGSTKGRYELGNAILDESHAEDVNYSKRLAYWSKKNIKVAGVGTSEIADSIIGGLRKIASDITINPEVVVDALDVLAEGQNGIDSISKKVDEKIAEAEAKIAIPVSKKDELRAALRASVDDGREARDEERKEIVAEVDRESERQSWERNISTPDAKIITDFSELGTQREDPNFRQALAGFARGALASQNMRMAAITNVTINGETITIAVQTDEGEESIDIPVSGTDTSVKEEEIVPEGDMAGEGLEMNMPPSNLPMMASSSKRMKRQAQSPMGGGIPGTPGDVAGGPGAPDQNLPDGNPAGEEGVQSLTTDEGMDAEVSDEIPTAGTQQPLGAVCPECGSTDVDVSFENGDIKGTCQNPECGAQYEALIKKTVDYKIIKPKSENGDVIPEVPEVPALPVAAQTRLDKGSIVRTASNKEKYGHVCPACGMTQCKASSENEGSVSYHCPACNTDIQKDIIVNINNPEDSYLRVAWDLVPNVQGCQDCKESVSKFASMLRVEKMMKSASESEFPTANCKELIARIYGGNATASFGPCKGKALADCVCGQLQRLGLRTVRHMEKLAAVSMQEDPMDECLDAQKKKGYDIKEASNICNCLKKKFASEIDDNIYIQAFAQDIKAGKEKILTAQDLSIINDMLNNVDSEPEVEDTLEDADIDIGDAITNETVSIEVSKDTADELAQAASEAVVEDDAAEVEVEVDVIEGEPEMDSATEVEVAANSEEEIVEAKNEEQKVDSTVEETPEKEIAMSMQTHKLRRVGEEVVKVAGTPKKVEDIEGDVKAGVPRGKATMGNEGADNIDVPMAKPSVPRSNAEMGNEGADNINPKAGLPDVAVDSSYMGDEKSVQKDMPAINNEIKGTVIAESDKVTKEAKQLKEVDTVEGEVEAGVPRGKATIGNEGADNIDVPMAKPSVPRGNAEMGNEGADNINPKADGPDVPVDNAYMGDEKNVQKDMPVINDQYLKQVQQEHRKEQQLERLATARKQEAMKVAYKLLASKRITEQAFDDVVEALSNFKIDQISAKAESMYPKKIVTASVSDNSAYAGPAIVMESKGINEASTDTFADKLSSHFTIGNKSFDENLTRFGQK